MVKKWILGTLIVLGGSVALIPILVVAGWIFSAHRADNHPETGVSEAHVDWLPPSASNVSYFKAYSYTAYEFNISEDDFVSWAGDKRLTEISDPVSILRFNFPDASFPKAENTAVIANGLWWETPPRGNGGGTQIAFDRDKKTAYFQDSPR